MSYLGHLMSHSPIDGKTNAVSSKKDHRDMTKPDVILDAGF